jgi:hypothetical protein
MSVGDVQVFGLMAGTCYLEDIAMDVPHGTTVTIPGVKAHVSKDLWRYISQKCLFHIQPGPGASMPMEARPPVAAPVPQEQQALREENAHLRAVLAANELASQVKLDAILALLRAGGSLPAVAGHQEPVAARAVSTGVVSGDVPTFIPSQIKPEGVEVQLTTKPEESEGAGVHAASSTLRKLRRGAGQ